MTTDDPAVRRSPVTGLSSDGDWAAQTVDSIDRVLAAVRAKTTVPLVRATRGVVFGLLAVVLATVVATLALITLIRVLSYLPGGVWVAYLITGLLCTLAGSVLMAKRRPPVSEEAP